MLDEKRLIRELKRGSEEALHQIYMEYKDRLLTIATALLRDNNAAEDVLHDVFVSFAGTVGGLQLRGSLRSYLTTSVVNRVRDSFRKKKHHMVELDEARRVAGDSGDPEKAAIFGEQSRQLADALTRLPPEQRETIVLHLNGRMKFKEIASMQGIAISTVQGRYRYGLGKLRAILKE